MSYSVCIWGSYLITYHWLQYFPITFAYFVEQVVAIYLSQIPHAGNKTACTDKLPIEKLLFHS